MNISLSPRLLTCCNFISPGDRVADVGTDHGYLGIWLLQQGIASSVIASDVVPGPLSAAKANAEKYGTTDKMEFYLSDGLQAVPRDFTVMVCAGMGGDTMIHILNAAPWLRADQYSLVLQCQSKTPMLRRYLSDMGWCIAKETVLRDGKFLYTVMDVRWQPDAPKLTASQCYISPALCANPTPELREYYDRILEGLRLAVTHQGDQEKAQILAELETVKF